MACTVKFNKDNKVESVNAPNGQESKLFDSLNKNVFVGSKDIAWDLQKSVYSENVEKQFEGVTDSKFVYETGEPKLYYSSNGKVSENLGEILLSPNSNEVKFGFLNPSTESFIEVGNTSISQNENEYQGYLVSQVRKGQLSAEKVEMDGEYFFQGAGRMESTKRINATLVSIESAGIMRGEKVKVNYNGTFSMVPNNDVLVGKIGDQAEILTLDNLEDALLNNVYDNQVDLVVHLLTTKGIRPEKSGVKQQAKKPQKSKEELISSLYNFLGRLGFSTTTVSEYTKNHKERVGEDPKIQALVDINKKILAFAQGELTINNLTEEVAHIAIEYFKDQETIESLLAQVVNYPEYSEFAEIYRQKYSEKYSGVELQDMVRREVLGKIIARKFQENFSEENLTEEQKPLHQRVYDLWRRLIRKIRGLVTPTHKKALDTLIDDVISSVVEEDLNQFNTDVVTDFEKVFYSLASNEKINLVNRLKSIKRALEDEFKKGLNENLALRDLLDKEEGMLIADQLQYSIELSSVANKLLSDLRIELEKADGTDGFVSTEGLTKFSILENLEQELAGLKLTIGDITTDNQFMDGQVKLLTKELGEFAKDFSEIKSLMNGDQTKYITNLVTEATKYLTEEDKQEASAKITENEKDTLAIGRYLAIPSNISNIVAGLIPKTVADMFSTARRRTLEVLNPFIDSITKEDALKYQTSIIKKDSKGNKTHYFENISDMDAFLKAENENKVKILKELTDIDEKEIRKALADRTVSSLKGYEEFADEFDKRNSEWSAENRELAISPEYLRKIEKRHKEANLSPETINLLRIKSNKVRPLRQKAMNADGKFDPSLLSKLERGLLDSYEVEFNRNKNALDTLGNLKQGLTQKKVKDLTQEEKSKLDFLGEFINDESIQEREIIIEDLNAPSISEVARIAIDLQNLDLLTSKEIGEGGLSFETDPEFINKLELLEGQGKYSEAMEWATLNGNITFTDEYYDSLAENKSYLESVEEYINSVEDVDRKNTLIATLNEYKDQLRQRNNLLKQVRSKKSPGEYHFEELGEDTKKIILELDENIDKLNKQINLPEEFRKGNELEFESGVTEDFINIATERNVPEVDLALENMTPKNKMQFDKYKSELFLFFNGGLENLSQGLNNFIESLEDRGVLTEENLDLYTNDQFTKIVLREFAKSKVASYFKRTTPKGYNELIKKLNNGEIKISEFVSNREKVISENPNLPVNLLKLNPSYSWRESLTGDTVMNPLYNDGEYRIQPKLFKDNGEPLYFDTKVASKYGISIEDVKNNYKGKLEDLTATKNVQEFEFLKRVVNLNKKIIENHGDTGLANPYKRIQIRKEGLEKFESIFKNESLSNIKDGLTDFFKNNKDEMIYGEEQSIDLKVIPKYYQQELDSPGLVSDNTLTALVTAYKQSELYKARTENRGKLEALQRHLESKSYEKRGLGKGKKVLKDGQSSNTALLYKSYLDSMLYGIQEDTQLRFNLMGAEVDITSLVRSVTGKISDLNLKYNFFVDLTSLTTGLTFQQIESIVQQNHSRDAFKKGRGLTTSLMLDYLGESGNINKKSIMNKYLELFGVEDIIERVGNSKYNKAVRLVAKSGYAGSKLANMPITPTIMNTIMYDHRFVEAKGEFLTALQYSTFRKQENPKITQTEIDTEWKNLANESYYNYTNNSGATIQPSEKLKEKWGEETDEKFNTITNNITSKINTLISNIDGRMSEDDKINLSRNFVGRSVLLHKGWLYLNMGRRFKERHFNAKTGQMETGYYRSFLKTAKSFATNMPKNNYDLIKTFKELKADGNYDEFTNFKKVITELGILGLFIIGGALVFADDDEDDTYLTSLSKLIFMRTYAEFNSTQVIGLPGLYIEQTKDPIVINNRIKDAAAGLSAFVKGDFEKAGEKAQKFSVFTDRYNKYSDIAKQYNSYMHFNKDNFIGVEWLKEK